MIRKYFHAAVVVLLLFLGNRMAAEGVELELIQEIPSCKMPPEKPLPERYYAVANKWKEFKWVHEVTSDMWRAGGQGFERADGSEMYEEYIFAKIDINGDGWCDWFLLSRTPFSTGGDSSVFNTLYLGSREGWRRIGVDIPKDEPDGLGWGKSDEQSSDYSFSSGHYLHYGIEQAIRLISLVFFSAQLWQGL